MNAGSSVIREITLLPVQDRSLTGSWRSDGIYGAVDCEEVDNTVCAGDSIGTEPTYKGFVTFDLSALPAASIDVSAAGLSFEIGLLHDDPFSDLGTRELEHVSFDEIGPEAFDAARLSLVGNVASSGQVGDSLDVNVISAVSVDAPARGRSQYRLAFTSPSDGDDTPDILVIDWSSPKLTLTYRVP